ncbi:MAG: DUF262 domain-containing protein [Patescibacteria group bacterium]|nr:DUF262 domain-containing protein [Patescibacteria group bacterium]
MLPYFIDWFKENVVVVKITAYSDENAYTIFETMNDRGLNVTPTEMLKGYVLSKITDPYQRNEMNDIWKTQIQRLHEVEDNADQNFFQAWFRAKYAKSIRPGKAGFEDQDFELIGSRFHNWFKENHKALSDIHTSDDMYSFFKEQFPYFVDIYLQIISAQNSLNANIPHAYYIGRWVIGESLQHPLLLAPIQFGDDLKTIERKIDFMARYIETFTVRRSVNYRKFGHSSIKYTMFNLVKAVRDKDLTSLAKILVKKVREIPETWEGIMNFGLHGMNGVFVKHLLCRITSYLDRIVGKDTTYVTYYHSNREAI